MKWLRRVIVALVLCAGVGIFHVSISRAVTAAYQETITIVDSNGTNIVTGTASATTALPQKTVRVVNASNLVMTSLGAGGGGTVITSCTGDLGSCTQTGAVLAAQVISGAHIASGTIPDAALVTAPLTSLVSPGPIGGTTSSTFQGTQGALGPSVPTLFSGTTILSNVTGPKLTITYNPTNDNLGLGLWLKSPATGSANSVMPFVFTAVGNPTHPEVWLDEAGGLYSKLFVAINGSANPVLDANGNLTTTADWAGLSDSWMFGVVSDVPGSPTMVASVTPSTGGTNNTDPIWCGKDSGTNSTPATTKYRWCIDGTGKLSWDPGTSATFAGVSFDTTLSRKSAGVLQVGTASIPTAAATLTAHGVALGEGTNTLAAMAVCGTGSFPFGQAAADPICSTLLLPNAATQGDLLTATAANTIGSVADVAIGQVLASGGTSTVPAYTASPNLTSVSTGTNPNITAGTGGVFAATEGTAATGAASTDELYADSTAHAWRMKNNNGTVETVVGTSGGTNEFAISAGPDTFGNTSTPNSFASGASIGSWVATNACHFVNLSSTNIFHGTTCTTAPTFNVYDGASNVGTAKIGSATLQARGTTTSQAESQTIAAGDTYGIEVSTAGGTCLTDEYVVTAEISCP